MRRVYLQRGDLLAIVVGVVLVGGFVLMASRGYWRLLPNFGFGPDWSCSFAGKGEPVCMKVSPAPTKPN